MDNEHVLPLASTSIVLCSQGIKATVPRMALLILYLPYCQLKMASDVASAPNISSSPPDNDAATAQSNQRTPDPRPATPYATGSAARFSVDDGKLNVNPNVPPYLCDDYNQYIQDDLDNNRVFLHVEKFLELVFDIPLSYRQEHAPRQHIDSILKDSVFRQHMTKFLEKCADAGPEAPLYTPLANLYNRGLELLDALDALPEDTKALKLHFSVNDPHHLCDGVFKKGLSPDLKSLLESLQQGAVAEINWTNVIKCVEVKAKDSPALCGGEYDPRPLHDGTSSCYRFYLISSNRNLHLFL